MTTSRLVVLSVALAVSGCEDPPPPIDPAAHSADVEAWREWRHADLMQPDGWLSLVGLYWLEPGRNTFGSDPGNKVVFRWRTHPRVLGNSCSTTTRCL